MFSRRPGDRFNRGRAARVGAVSSVFNPATESLDGWWRASYSGVPWTPTASAGASLANGDLVSGGTAPIAGAAVNGLTPAAFNGTSHSLIASTATPGNLITVSAMSVVALFRRTAAAPAPAANFYDDDAIVTDNGGNWGLVITSSGVRAGIFVSASKHTASIAVGDTNFHLAAMTFDGTTLAVYLDGSTQTTAPGGNIASLGNTFISGKNYAGSAFAEIEILEIITKKAAYNSAAIANFKSYFNSRYALSL